MSHQQVGRPIKPMLAGVVPGEEHLTGGCSPRESVRMYIEEKLHPGDFLASVAANDLFGAAWCADEENRERLADIATFFWRYAPGSSVSSQANVDAWLASD